MTKTTERLAYKSAGAKRVKRSEAPKQDKPWWDEVPGEDIAGARELLPPVTLS